MKRVVFIVAGSIMLFASAMKAHALAHTTVSPQKISSDWWLQTVSVGAELLVGAWLIAGVWPRAVRAVATLCFAGFSCVAAFKLIQGEESCGCLGNLTVHPAYTLAADLLLVSGLCWVRVPVFERVRPLVPACFLLALAVLAVGVEMRIYASATELSRGLRLDATSHEFGEVEQNQILTHEFTLTNNTTLPVEVVETSSTCGCTTVKDVTGRVIQVGESLVIPVTLKTGESETHLIGRITLYCRPAGSTSPPSFFQELAVTARVQPDYWVRPLVVDFGVIESDAPVIKVFKLRPNRKPDIRIREVTSSHPAFTVRVLDARSDEGDLQVEVRFCGRSLTNSGVVETPLQVVTDSMNRPSVRVLARAVFRSPITVEPDSLVIASNVIGPVEREIVVVGGKPFGIDGVTPTGAMMTAIAEQQSDRRWTIRVTVPPAKGQGFRAEVRFRTTLSADPGTNETRDLIVPVFRLAP
ncbi:DUF1573 domain-containing protein [Gemmata palustris]